MNVTLFRADEGGCDYYRGRLPLHTAREKSQSLDLAEVWHQEIIADLQVRPQEFAKKMDSDVFVLQRISTPGFLNRIQKIMKERKRGVAVCDFDDDVFNVSPLSPHYKDFGLKNADLSNGEGDPIPLWRDGENLDIKKNQERIDGIKKILEDVDLVTTTTDILADVFRQYNGNVAVLPNCVDLPAWRKPKVVRDNSSEIRLYWCGGYSHYEDLLMIREPIREIMNKYHQAKFVMAGWKPKGFEAMFKRPEQFEFHPKWVHPEAHSYRTALLDIDIQLIPLVDNEFNRSKSAIKWIEAGAMGVPTVASAVSPYIEMDSLVPDAGIFIADNDPQGWVRGISELIEDPILRAVTGQKARQVVELNFDINSKWHLWELAYEEALACRTLR